MKTLIKPNEYRGPITGYEASQLENCDEISALIQEYQSQLSGCPHCGHSHAIILYYYMHCDTPLEDHPHKVEVRCHKGYSQEPVGYCGCQSKTWYAKDEEQDFREALRLVVEGWNRRP